MSKLQTLMESEQVKNILTENQVLLEDATAKVAHFYDYLHNFILENITEFLDENLQETAKNVYVRSY